MSTAVIFWVGVIILAAVGIFVGLAVSGAAKLSRNSEQVKHRPDSGNLYNPDGVRCIGCGQDWPCPPEAERRLRLYASRETPLRTPGPLPAVGEIDSTDYVRRIIEHQPCEAYPCPHEAFQRRLAAGALYVPDHCRCGNEWPCPLAGPFNAYVPPQPRNRNRQGWL